MTNATYSAHCFCGAVEVELAGDPADMGYCHCDSCRHWSAGPVNAFTLSPTAAVKITRGEDRLGVYAGTPNSRRRWLASRLTGPYCVLVTRGMNF